MDTVNPKTTHFEFFGPVGAAAVTIGTPLLTYWLFLACTPTHCATASLPILPPLQDFLTLQACGLYAAWFLLLMALYYLLPGEQVQGQPLVTGTKLSYKINGFSSLRLILAVVVAGLFMNPKFLEPLWEQTLPLLTASLLASIGLALWSYTTSYTQDKALLAHGGNSGIFIYDFFIGRHLNPRLFNGSFDVKYFCELRPGLFLWVLLNLANLMHQYNTTGTVGLGMLLVCAFQIWYATDSVINEEKVLSTMDITTDGFGFMLAFGDLCWVPFVYSQQSRYLALHPVTLSWPILAAVVASQAIGFYLFRSANSQKDRFRNDPTHASVKDLRFIQTQRGTKLLCDGWWGKARHINYLGDWIMAWSYCLPTGFGMPLTYFYVVYFAVLLIHRERRDEDKCSRKYGKDWLAYKAKVPWRIIPYVY
ncbi:ergosterol biosynthesis ERG4/ERG24 [Protomyces lactucae-debilis]|uniref:Delta(14)-sterol reductase n=1 Tax=Protomyces lactucae-debilis TaxID=2754530 RepID=A0A1Y2FBY3_PROLT|nr:ergosterol biosynthesis ERG4/ERG24 [Protomyces lactucae-debilis]ORY80944.1 ergosterol biosynthesis ERG4/ERG24 [Protomyces lactucae-debilis]